MYFGLSVLTIAMASCKSDVKVEATTTDTDTTKVVTEEAAPAAKHDTMSMQAYATPGVQHKMMAEAVGSWNNDMTMWWGAEPTKATSTSEVKMLLGGRYQEMTYKGMMEGMPFEGRGTMAYDNLTKEYTSTWIDNMGTGMMVMRGKMAEGANTLELKGDMVDPSAGMAIPCREVLTFIDKNNHKMEMFCTKDGKESKSMEIVMKRK